MGRSATRVHKREIEAETGRSRAKPVSDAIINLRVPRALRDNIDSAAAALGKTRTEFVLDSVRDRATDVLLDRKLFTLDHARYAAFLRALEAPPAPNAKLKQLLRSKSPWEK